MTIWMRIWSWLSYCCCCCFVQSISSINDSNCKYDKLGDTVYDRSVINQPSMASWVMRSSKCLIPPVWAHRWRCHRWKKLIAKAYIPTIVINIATTYEMQPIQETHDAKVIIFHLGYRRQSGTVSHSANVIGQRNKCVHTLLSGATDHGLSA